MRQTNHVNKCIFWLRMLIKNVNALSLQNLGILPNPRNSKGSYHSSIKLAK
jgi:hypothetical protein